MNLKKQAKQIQRVGYKNSGQDSMLAHISPMEAMMLKAHGGSGRIDPRTGLPHFDDFGGGDSGENYGNEGGNYGEGGLDAATEGVFGSDTSFGNEGFTFGESPFSLTDYSDIAPYAALHDPYGSFLDNDLSAAYSESLAPSFADNLEAFAKAKALGHVKGVAANALGLPGMLGVPTLNAAIAAFNAPEGQKGETALNKGFESLLDSTLFAMPNLMNSLVNVVSGQNNPSFAQGLMSQGGYKGGEGYGNSYGNAAMNSPNEGLNDRLSQYLNLGATGAGLYSMFQAGQDARHQANSLSNMFSQNSPFAQQLRQQLERRDAASGRRSQYGPREVELQAALAKMAAGIQPSILESRQAGNKNMMQMLSMLTSANKMGVFDPVKGWLGGMFGDTSGSYTPSSTDLSGQYSGDSYGEWDLGGYGG